MKSSKLLSKLNSQQIKAVTCQEGPLLIIAGAGTGKTTVIAHRIAWLIEQGLAKPSEILALTFTDKAATEMDERILELLPYGVLDFTASTFHSFCQDLLKDHGIIAGISPDFQLLTEAQQILFLRQNIDEFDLNLYKPISNPDKFLASLIKLFSRAKDENTSPQEYAELAKKYQVKSQTNPHNLELAEEALTLSEQAKAYKIYERLKNKQGFYDFGDLIIKTSWLLKKYPSILAKIQAQYKYIFVDEFQDTNYVQAQITYQIAQKYKNITVVGDDDQSIYKFRGASIANIMDFVKHYPQATTVTLTKNYRSSQEILHSAYRLITNNNPERLEVKEKVNKKLYSNKHGLHPEFWRFSSGFSEVEVTIRDIVAQAETGKKFGDFAILVRANHHADDFITLLKDNGIPYHFIGSRGLYDREEIRELRSWLKVLYNPDDGLALFHVAMSDQFKIDKVFLRRLTNIARQKNISLFEMFENIEDFNPPGRRDKKSIDLIVTLIKKHLQTALVWPTSKILVDYIYQSGAYQLIKNIQDYETQEKVENIKIFFTKIAEFERVSEDKSLFSFVEYLGLIIEAGDNPAVFQADKYEEAVNIMTIHAAKGLEFDTVYLPYLVDGRFPSRERKDPLELPDELIKENIPSGDIHLQEERRLFYVAMTRAKNRLIFTASTNYLENKREKRISRFVNEAVSKKYVRDLTKKTNLDFLKINASEKKSKPEKKALIILSPSNLETYAECPKRFEYSYVFKISPEPTQAISFGNSIHNTLRDYFKLLISGQKLSGKKITELYSKNWQPEGYRSKKSLLEAFQKGLEAVKQLVKTDQIIPHTVEKKFTLNIDDICQLKGRIDRINKLGDGITIIDYKTGDGQKKTISEISKNIPLWTYALKFAEDFKGRKIIITLYYLMNQKVISQEVTQEKLTQKKEEIKEVCVKIHTSLSTQDFPATPSEFKCRYCSYKSICPYKARGA